MATAGGAGRPPDPTRDVRLHRRRGDLRASLRSGARGGRVEEQPRADLALISSAGPPRSSGSPISSGLSCQRRPCTRWVSLGFQTGAVLPLASTPYPRPGTSELVLTLVLLILSHGSEWAILLPAWSMMLVLCTYAGYAVLMLYNTPSLSSAAWLDSASCAVWSCTRKDTEQKLSPLAGLCSV